MKVKIMNWNILHGFHQSEYPYALDHVRLNSAIWLVKKAKPDILALTEACYGGSNPFKTKMNYEQIFGYKYGFFGRWGNYEWGNMLLSNYPISGQSLIFADRTALRCRLNIEDKFLNFDVIHMSPYLKEKKKAESVTNLIRESARPYILTGDFNAISPADNYSKARLQSGFAKLMGVKKANRYVNDLLKGACIRNVLREGLLDTYRTLKGDTNYTVPTDVASINKSTGLRVDYIFCSSGLKVSGAGIIKSKYAETASDHYPTYAIMSL